MFTLNSKCNAALAVVAGAAFAFLVSAQTAAFAENAPNAITQSAPPKQVGLWMVNGWKRGTAEATFADGRVLSGNRTLLDSLAPDLPAPIPIAETLRWMIEAA